MKFGDFKSKFGDLPLIPSRIVAREQADLNQLERWRKNGRVLRLRRGLYILGESERKVQPSRLYLAGQIYQPSYVSLEYALSGYGLIPERVADVTSVSSRKTAKFTNAFGTFSYQTVRPPLFRGFIVRKDEAGLDYFIAEPEKAVADFVYLKLGSVPAGAATKVLRESFRFQNLSSLRKPRLRECFALFNIKKMDQVAAALCSLAGRKS